jgi:hypothetical protein
MAEPLRIYEKTLYERGNALLRDLSLALRHAEKLRFLFTGNDGDAPSRPEMSTESYENVREAVDALIEIVVPRFYPVRRQPYSRGAIASEGLQVPSSSEMWLFVNGVATSPAVLKANGKELARIFQRPIHLVHNPTDSVLLDLAECILGRTFNFKTALSQYVLDIVSRALVGYSKVVLIGHSQGGIVVADVANALVRYCEDRDLLKNLEIYTFASAADEMLADDLLTRKSNHCVPYYEHFANGDDFVARFGVIGCKEAIAGPLFVNEDRKGHLLNAHYLESFQKGEYCGGKSRLFQYVDGGAPADRFEKLPAKLSQSKYIYTAV